MPSTFSRVLPLVVASALFMEQMESTIIATALPPIARDLGVSAISLKLALTTYLLGLTVFLPVSGWAADRFGAKRVFSLAIIIFTGASVACGFAQSLEGLVIARGLQGVGGALMVPVGRIVILRSVPKSDLLDAMAWLTIPALIGPMIGPPIGGYLSTYYDWRWIFWMNLPLGMLALTLTWWKMPDLATEHVQPLDWFGFALSGLGLGLAMMGLTMAGRDIFTALQVAGMIVTGLLLIAAYVFYALRKATPILDLRLLRFPTYRISIIGGNVFRIAVGAAPFLLPLMLQLGFGYTAAVSGLISFASAVGAFLMKFTVKPLVKYFGYRNVLIYNGAAGCALLAAQAFFRPDTPWLIMSVILFAAGFARSLQFSSLNTLAYADIAHEDLGKANGLYTVLQQLFLALGVAVAAFLLDARMWWSGRVDVTADDFSFAFLVVSLASALSVLFYLKLDSRAGASISGRETE